MALNAAQQWWIRAGGADTNSGGFDSTISGAGTNYADQDAAQLSLTDVACANSTTVTSATGGFTSAMIGNILRISGGTNFTAGYYAITGRTDTNTITVDRNPTTGASASGGTGKVGGAFGTIAALSNGGSITAPSVATPLAAGHTVNVRGAGSDSPSSADWTHGDGVYATFPAGSASVGRIYWVGYNGRPRIDGDTLMFYSLDRHVFRNFYHKSLTQQNNTQGFIHGIVECALSDIVVDMGGMDGRGLVASNVFACRVINTGSTAVGNSAFAGIDLANYGLAIGNVVSDHRSHGIRSTTIGTVSWNVCYENTLSGIVGESNVADHQLTVLNNTCHGNGGDGIRITGATGGGVAPSQIYNNILTANGGYGLNFSGANSQAVNDLLLRVLPNYNNYGTGATANTSGARNKISAGANDLALDPQFTNAAAGDFSVGTNMKAVGFPGAFPGGVTTGYLDLGAAQRVEPVSSPFPAGLFVERIG